MLLFYFQREKYLHTYFFMLNTSRINNAIYAIYLHKQLQSAGYARFYKKTEIIKYKYELYDILLRSIRVLRDLKKKQLYGAVSQNYREPLTCST